MAENQCLTKEVKCLKQQVVVLQKKIEKPLDKDVLMSEFERYFEGKFYKFKYLYIYYFFKYILLIIGDALLFMRYQLINANKGASDTRGRRWDIPFKSLCLSILHTSRKCYQLLETFCNLPSISTLTRSMVNINIRPGFFQNILNMMKIDGQHFCLKDKICSLSFDEMAIQKRIIYNPQYDYIEGFVDYGDLGRTENIADKCLAIMARGINTSWKQVIGYFLTKNSVKKDILKCLILQAVEKLDNVGYIVKVIICDQGSTNRYFININ